MNFVAPTSLLAVFAADIAVQNRRPDAAVMGLMREAETQRDGTR